jgi:hypothetical protein
MRKVFSLTAFAAVAAMAAVTGTSHAAGLSFEQLSTGQLNQVFDPSPGVGLAALAPKKGDTISLGQLTALMPGTITFTYLGQESGFKNSLDLRVGTAGNVLTETTVGDRTSASIGAGIVDFRFFDSNGKGATNGAMGGWDTFTSIGLLATGFTVSTAVGSLKAGDQFDFVLAFNDSGKGHDDWDDYVVGVNMAPIPEPGTYALMLAGLAAVGFVARRRKA